MNEDEKAIKAEYDKRPYVGYFRVLQGCHNEGGRTYHGKRRHSTEKDSQGDPVILTGEIVHSKSDLLKLNPANPQWERKYEKVDPPADQSKPTKVPRKEPATA